MTSHKTTVKDIVQRMLHTGQRLRGIIVLVVNVQVVMLHSVTTLARQQIVVHERFGRLRRKFHHHASRRVGIHISILARYVVALDIYDIQEYVASLGLTGDRTLIAVSNVLLGHILATRLHQLQFHHVLNLLNRHLTVASLSYMVSYLV